MGAGKGSGHTSNGLGSASAGVVVRGWEAALTMHELVEVAAEGAKVGLLSLFEVGLIPGCCGAEGCRALETVRCGCGCGCCGC